MAHSLNDKLSRGWLKYDGTASANDVLSGVGARIHLIVLAAGSTTSSVIVYDAATATGTDLIKLTALASGNSATVDLGPNGHVFSTGISTTLAGTGALYTIFYTEA